jgi:hypothetical protein
MGIGGMGMGMGMGLTGSTPAGNAMNNLKDGRKNSRMVQ